MAERQKVQEDMVRAALMAAAQRCLALEGPFEPGSGVATSMVGSMARAAARRCCLVAGSTAGTHSRRTLAREVRDASADVMVVSAAETVASWASVSEGSEEDARRVARVARAGGSREEVVSSRKRRKAMATSSDDFLAWMRVEGGGEEVATGAGRFFFLAVVEEDAASSSGVASAGVEEETKSTASEMQREW